MIIESLKIYLQNVWKNRSLIEILLETHKIQYFIHSRTFLVYNLNYSQFFQWKRKYSCKYPQLSELDYIF